MNVCLNLLKCVSVCVAFEFVFVSIFCESIGLYSAYGFVCFRYDSAGEKHRFKLHPVLSLAPPYLLSL